MYTFEKYLVFTTYNDSHGQFYLLSVLLMSLMETAIKQESSFKYA